jgi:hypothetical protein
MYCQPLCQWQITRRKAGITIHKLRKSLSTPIQSFLEDEVLHLWFRLRSVIEDASEATKEEGEESGTHLPGVDNVVEANHVFSGFRCSVLYVKIG